MDATQRQEDIEVITIPEDMGPADRETLEEVMLQLVIEAFLVEIVDNIIETNLGVIPIRLRPVFDFDELSD